MSLLNNAIIGAAGQQGYKISRSVRLRSSASAYFNRTPATTTNRRTWTVSFWIKRGKLFTGTEQAIFGSNNGTTYTELNYFASSDVLRVNLAAGSATYTFDTTAVFRDPSAWYHVVLAVDTTQATSTDRIKIYINGVQQVGTNTPPTLNYDTQWNVAQAAFIGSRTASTWFTDCYLTDFYNIDGQALTPSSFGQTNSVTGVWQPIKYGGTYGTNGFYLNFSDNSAATAAAIGKDSSGNGNNWTPNNISVTAGATYDSMLDVPTLYADGGNGRGNYAVMNPLDAYAGAFTFADGNLKVTFNSGTWRTCIASMRVSSGKWYWESTFTSISGAGGYSVGVGNESTATANNPFTVGNGAFMYEGIQGFVYNNGTQVATVATATTNDVMGCALDADAKTLAIYKNNSLLYTITGLTGSLFVPILADSAVGAAHTTINFGQRPFSYTPPTGFVALNTQNLPTPTISNGANHMAATTYAGSASEQVINSNLTSLNFAWIKDRTSARSHVFVDTVRGGSPMLTLYSDLTAVEDNISPNYNPTSISGSSITLAGAKLGINNSGENYVMWGWSAGSSNVTNTSGSITSTVSVNASAGFSVVGYTGTAANATIGHGLGVAPKMIIVKNRQTATNWPVYHSSIGQGNYLYLNTTLVSTADTTMWNNTAPTSSVFSLGTNGQSNNSANTYVAYCFSEVAGYSKFGTWTNNNSTDGTFIYLGFRPRCILLKNTDNVECWYSWDSSRQTYNMQPPSSNWLSPNFAYAEAANNAGTAEIDGLSNGFKIRTTNPAAGEVSFGTRTYIYAAFAENPFKNALAR